MTYAQAFCNSPKHFMEKHVVLVGIGDDELRRDLIDVSVTDLTALEGFRVAEDPDARVFGLYEIRGETDEPSIGAYWCRYEKNTAHSVMLGNDAFHMFTETMNGCTFGVGSYAGAGVQRVSHVNMARSGVVAQADGLDAARAQQRKLQRHLIRSQLGAGAAVAEPDDYMAGRGLTNEFESTTFGSHGIAQPWKFYTHRYKRIGDKTFLHGGVHRVR